MLPYSGEITTRPHTFGHILCTDALFLFIVGKKNHTNSLVFAPTVGRPEVAGSHRGSAEVVSPPLGLIGVKESRLN